MAIWDHHVFLQLRYNTPNSFLSSVYASDITRHDEDLPISERRIMFLSAALIACVYVDEQHHSSVSGALMNVWRSRIDV